MKQVLQERIQEDMQQRAFDFASDEWLLYEYAPKGQEHVRQVVLHFSDRAGEQVKQLIKQYAFWRLGRVKPVTVRQELTGHICHWESYLVMRGICDPRCFCGDDYGAFHFWLCARGVGAAHRNRILTTLHQLLTIGQRLGWQVTKKSLPQVLFSDEFSCGQQIPGNAPGYSVHGRTEPIPFDVYQQILTHARFDETDEITRCGILVQSQTGLRISEVLSLRTDCLCRCADGSYQLWYQLKKTQRGEPVLHPTPANEIVCEAIARLRAATEQLRQESGRTELFLVRNHGIRLPSQTNWNGGRLRNFLKRWEITGVDGSIYALHSHQFRATYVTQQLLAGVPLDQLKKNLGHVSAEMTARYVHLSTEQLQTFLTDYMICKETEG